METIAFKTNLKCGGCVATITPFLDGDDQVQEWSVDLENPQRILKVATSHSAEEIETLIQKAGFVAEEIA